MIYYRARLLRPHAHNFIPDNGVSVWRRGGVGYHRAPCQSEREREREKGATKSRGTDYASRGQPSSCYVEIGSLGRVPNC